MKNRNVLQFLKVYNNLIHGLKNSIYNCILKILTRLYILYP